MRLSVLILGVLVLSSCGGNPALPEKFADYQDRLANILDTKSPPIKHATLEGYPSKKQLQHNLPDTKIKLVEFYQLKHCQLSSLIAERNTTLGKLQLPSVRYIYEARLLNALDSCIEHTQDTKLLAKLNTWKQVKQAHLPFTWANLIQNSEEIKYAFSTNKGYITGTKNDGLAATLEGLSFITKLSPSSSEASSMVEDISSLERHLQQIKHYSLPAKLWLSQLSLAEQLNQSTIWLLKQNTQLACQNGKANRPVKYMANVFQRYFVEQVQPIASQINYYHYQLSPVLNALVAQQALSPNFTRYIVQHNEQNFKMYQNAMKQHIEFWQQLFKRCNLHPNNLAL